MQNGLDTISMMNAPSKINHCWSAFAAFAAFAFIPKMSHMLYVMSEMSGPT